MRHRPPLVLACSDYGRDYSLKNVLPPFSGWWLGRMRWHRLLMTSLVLRVSSIDSTLVLNSNIPAVIRVQVFKLMSLETFPPSLASKSCCLQSLSELRSKVNEVHRTLVSRFKFTLYFQYLGSRIRGISDGKPRNVSPQSSILELNLLSLSFQVEESKVSCCRIVSAG